MVRAEKNGVQIEAKGINPRVLKIDFSISGERKEDFPDLPTTEVLEKGEENIWSIDETEEKSNIIKSEKNISTFKKATATNKHSKDRKKG